MEDHKRETLPWVGTAPIYDSGSSLGYDKVPAQMRTEREAVCKPFKNHHTEQIRLVTSFDWIDFDRLSDVQELITGVLSAEGAKPCFPPTLRQRFHEAARPIRARRA